MPDDALAKAAEALRRFIRSRFCEACSGRLLSPEGCLSVKASCWLGSLYDLHCASEAARAVLEAAGYERLRVVVDAAKAYMEHCSVLDCMSDDDPVLCEDVETCYKERLRAALARVGKEA